MRLLFPTVFLGLLVTLPLSAGDDGLTGSWKLSIYDGGKHVSFWILNIQSKDGKLAITADPLKGAPKVEVKDIHQSGDAFSLKVEATIQKQTIHFDFEGKLPKPGAKKILGSLSQGGSTVPAILEATTAKSDFGLDRELLMKSPSDPRAFVAILDLIDGATANKVDPKELQTWINSSLKAAELYGPRFQIQHQIRVLEILQEHRAFADVTLETARAISRQIDGKLPPEAQLQLLSAVADILRKAGQRDDAAKIEPRIDKLEVSAYAAYAKDSLNFKPVKFTGRKANSKRAVLVELFTGAQCPPCVAADMAFDGLEKTYGPGDVVLLQYHLHIPRPDPLSNADSEARYEYYLDVKKARGTPSPLFNGHASAQGGGFREDAADKYKEYTDVINKLIELPDAVKLSATATRTGDKIAINAKVSELAKPGDKIRLRLVLVEDWVRYRGSNGLGYHHRVVRSMPGGAKGFTIKQKEAEHSADVDLDKLRKSLNKYLDEDYPEGFRPMRLRNLHVVAFVQDDDTNEVLGAIDVAVKEGSGR